MPESEADSFGEVTPHGSNILTTYGHLDEEKAETEFCFPDGKVLRESTALLLDAVARSDMSRATIRKGGSTTIYPIVEERLVLTKELILREERHLRRPSGP